MADVNRIEKIQLLKEKVDRLNSQIKPRCLEDGITPNRQLDWHSTLELIRKRDASDAEIERLINEGLPSAVPAPHPPAKKKTATALMWEGVNLAGRQINQKHPGLDRPQIAAILKENAVKNKLRYAGHSVETIEKHLTGICHRGKRLKTIK
jgi:hypothetical protein